MNEIAVSSVNDNWYRLDQLIWKQFYNIGGVNKYIKLYI